jgi:hypothetical protein
VHFFGSSARVERVNAKENLLTDKRDSGEEVSYDPRRLHGVTLYRETGRAFSGGDRVQFTAPNRDHHIANRELGTIEKIDGSGNLQLRLDLGRTLAFNIRDNPHLDYGYAVTSHSSQGQTADRVLVHVDTEQRGEKLSNRRLAYVAVSRGRYDAQSYTNDKINLSETLSRDVSHQSAMDPRHTAGPAVAKQIGPSSSLRRATQQTIEQGLTMSPNHLFASSEFPKASSQGACGTRMLGSAFHSPIVPISKSASCIPESSRSPPSSRRRCRPRRRTCRKRSGARSPSCP